MGPNKNQEILGRVRFTNDIQGRKGIISQIDGTKKIPSDFVSAVISVWGDSPTIRIERIEDRD